MGLCREKTARGDCPFYEIEKAEQRWYNRLSKLRICEGAAMLLLRDMREDDIEDYVRWFTTETEWMNWDAPWEWESISERSIEEERQAWKEYYASVKDLPDDSIRWKYEIEADGKHIGWICSYTDLGYLENREEILAVGLDIPETDDRRKGHGTKAFKLFLDYLRKHGHNSFFTQTWSGNIPMMKAAERLGFTEIVRKTDYREVNGKKYDAVTFRLDL